MKIRNLITISLLLHGLLFFTAGLKIGRSSPVAIVKEADSNAEQNITQDFDLFQFFLEHNYNPDPISETKKRKLSRISTLHINETIYVVEYDFGVLILLLLSATFHLYTFRKLGLQPVR